MSQSLVLKRPLALQNTFTQHENMQRHHSGLIVQQHSSDKKPKPRTTQLAAKPSSQPRNEGTYTGGRLNQLLPVTPAKSVECVPRCG